MYYTQLDNVNLRDDVSLAGPEAESPTSFLREKVGLVADWNNLPPYYDEPRMYHFISRLPAVLEMEESEREWLDESNAVTTAGGCSFEKNRAMWKLVGESAEREALIYREELPIRYSSYNGLGETALDPNLIPAGKGKDHDDRRPMKMGWVLGKSFTTDAETWVPAQLVYVPYFYQDEEAIIRSPMSTGAAAGASFEKALYSGLSEVVERDAFMVAWLKQLDLIRIPHSLFKPNTSSGKLIYATLKSMDRYNLVPELYVLPTDVASNVVMCVIKDNSGIGPNVTVGAKASWSFEAAVVGALEEAQQLRPWLRSILENEGIQSSDTKENAHIGLNERARLWLTDSAVNTAHKWLRHSQYLDVLPRDKPPFLSDLIESISRAGAHPYFVNLTTERLKNLGIFVVKVIVPQFQPLYLDEQYADYVNDRLENCENRLGAIPRHPRKAVEQFPHPFL